MGKQTITLRLTINDPVPGVCYSLQGKDGEPVDAVTATEASLSLDAPVTLNDDNRLTGPFVRARGRRVASSISASEPTRALPARPGAAEPRSTSTTFPPTF